MQNLHHEEKIECYLESVRSRLNILPEAERDAEIAEIRTHLLALAQSHIELGAAEPEAIQAALSQFGNPKSVGKNLRYAWERGRNQRLPGTVLSAAGWTFVATLASDLIMTLVCIMTAELTHNYKDLGAFTKPDVLLGISGLSRLLSLFTGYVTGLKAPRRAYVGMLLTSALSTGLITIFIFRHNLPHMSAEALSYYLLMCAIAIGIGLATQLFGVWLGRRQFLARQRRERASV